MIRAFTEMTDECHLPDMSFLEPDYWEDRDYQYGNFDKDGLRLEYRVLLSQYLCIRHQKLLLQQSRSLRIHQSRPVIQMYFVLNGHCTLIQDQKVLISVGEMEHAVLDLMDEELTMEIRGDEELEIVDILIVPDFIDRYLPVNDTQFPKAGFTDRLCPAGFNLAISPRMLTILFEILQCELEG